MSCVATDREINMPMATMVAMGTCGPHSASSTTPAAVASWVQSIQLRLWPQPRGCQRSTKGAQRNLRTSGSISTDSMPTCCKGMPAARKAAGTAMISR